MSGLWLKSTHAYNWYLRKGEEIMLHKILLIVFAATLGVTTLTAGVNDAFANSSCCDSGTVEPPSAAYPFVDKYVLIDGFRIHYVEEGRHSDKPIIFIHGNPTWSYIWRNIIPGVAKKTHRRVIAIDLLGMGRSDKPVLDYTPQLHTEILRKFIEKLGLDNIILVGHDWGGAIMTGYAVNYPWKVEGLVFMETFAWKFEASDFGIFEPIFRLARSPEGQDLLVNHPTWYVDNLIKPGVLNTTFFTDEVFSRYLEPFPTPESRTAMAKFPLLIPFLGDPQTLQVSLDYFNDIEVKRAVLANKEFLLIRGNPGTLISDLSFNKFQAFASVLPNFEIKDFGPGLHPLQEDNPAKVVCLISNWIWEKELSGRRKQNNHDEKEERK
jgi:haloalkane dehalogenase